MPITFDCPKCGKPCKASAEMAGRKAKCQDCKAVITVPAEEEAIADKPVPKRKAVPAAADDDDERPRAKKSRKDDEEDTPRRKKSRKDDDEEEDERPRAKKSRKDDDDDEEDKPRAKKSRKDDDDDDSPRAKKSRKYHDDDDDRPRASGKKGKGKKSGSGVGMILLLGGGAFALLALCGGGGLLAWWMFGGASEMAFAPDGCNRVRSTRVSQVENSSAYQTMTRDNPNAKKQFAAPGNNDAITQAGVDSIFVAGSDAGEITIIKTKKAVTVADLTKGKTLKETKAGKYTMLEGANEAACLADDTTIVLCNKPDLLKKVLERGKAPELSDSMKKALGYTSFSKSIAFAAADTGAKKGAGGLGGGFTGAMLENPECTGGYQQFDSDISFSQTHLFKDAQAAEAAKKKHDDGIEALKKLLGAGKPGDNPLLEMMQATKVSVSGSEVRAEGTYKADLLARMSKPANPGGGGPGPGGGMGGGGPGPGGGMGGGKPR